jgi:hypothetical protein
MDTQPDPDGAVSVTASNRRRSPRNKVRHGVVGEMSSTPVQILEINVHGCLISAASSFRAVYVQALHVEMEGDSGVFYVRVVHVMRANSGAEAATLHLAGLEFLTPGAQHDTIERLIAFCAD